MVRRHIRTHRRIATARAVERRNKGGLRRNGTPPRSGFASISRRQSRASSTPSPARHRRQRSLIRDHATRPGVKAEIRLSYLRASAAAPCDTTVPPTRPQAALRRGDTYYQPINRHREPMRRSRSSTSGRVLIAETAMTASTRLSRFRRRPPASDAGGSCACPPALTQTEELRHHTAYVRQAATDNSSH